MNCFRRIFGRDQMASELAEEMRLHLEEKIEALEREGMSREKAVYAARRAFGNATVIAERSREAWQWPRIESLWADAKYALRQLRNSPGFAVVSILSLALGIGATTAIFSIIDCVILRPLPYRGAERMVHLNLFDRSGDRGYAMVSGAQFLRLKRAGVLDGAVAEDNWTMATTGEEFAQSVQVDQLSANAFDFFGMPPILGRGLTDADAPLGEEPSHVVVLGYRFWRSHFGGRPNVIGKVLQLDHKNYAIVGVMSKRFSWGSVGGYAASDAYLPLKLSDDQSLMYPITARLKPGATSERTDTELQAIYKRFAQETPDRFPADFKVHAVNLKESAIGSIRGTLFVLFGAVAILLAIGCINVGILFLARGVLRRNEFAVRSALGAQRARLVRQLLTESFIVSLAGGILGIPVAFAGLALWMQWIPQDMLPAGIPIHVNVSILLFSISVTMITGICCGLRPALEFSRPVASQMLADSTRSATGSAANKRVHTLLLINQVAFSVLLLAAALAAVRTLTSLYKAKLGYDPTHVLIMGLPLMEGSYPSWSQRINYYSQIRQKLAALPEVSSVAITTQELPPISRYVSDFTILGKLNQAEQTTTLEQVSGEYFSTLRIPLLEGRVWSDAESMHAAHTAVINQTMAKRYWPRGNAIGQTIKIPNLTAKNLWVFDAPGNNGEVQIIGIVGDVPNAGLHEQVLPAVYVPYTLIAVDWLQFVVKTKVKPMTLVHAAREQLRSVNTAQNLNPIETAEDRLSSAGWAQERFIASLFSVLAVLALSLSAVGLYSVVSYTVSQSSKEFGIRMALGATRGHILLQVALSVGTPVGLGLLAGATLSISFNSVFLHWTNAGISNPLVLAWVVTILTLVSLLAAIAPALRAASIDPMKSLRAG